MLPEHRLPETMSLLWNQLDDKSPVPCSAALFAAFSLQQNPGRLLAVEKLWPAMLKAIGEEHPIETGLPKPRAEFLVYGACHTGKHAQALEVRAEVGEIRKSLLVFGPRSWSAGVITHQGSFLRMPLDYAHAFGGPGYAHNPLGKGHESTGANELPNVEHPHKLLAQRSDTPPPAGFNALPPHWPQRAELLGRLDAQWCQKHWPFLPGDTHPEYANIAPSSQRLPNYFRGDEPVRLHNMHPHKPRIESALPGLRGRLFCKRRNTPEDQVFEEIPLQPETLWLFPEQELGVLLLRGGFNTVDDECSDIAFFYAAWEPLEQSSRAASEHFEEMRARHPAPAQPQPESPPPQESKEPDAATQAATQAGAASVAAAVSTPSEQAPSELQEIHKDIQALQDDAAKSMQEAGISAEEIQEMLQEPAEEEEQPDLEPDDEKLAQERNELRQFLADSDRDPAELERMSETDTIHLQLQQLMSDVRRRFQEAGVDTSALDESETPLEGEEELFGEESELEDTIARALQEMKESGQDTDELEASLAELRQTAATVAQLGEVDISGGTSAPSDQEAASTQQEEPPTPLQRIHKRLQDGDSLEGLDLAGADLSGLDLSDQNLAGCSLREANLENCNLRSSVLDNANLEGAQLSGADLGQASLLQAVLRHASATGMQAAGASFYHADLQQAELIRCDLSGTDFTATCLHRTLFEDCSLRDARLGKAEASRASFEGSDLASASFAQAALPEASLRRTRLDKASFILVRAPKLRLQGAKGQGPDFRQAALAGSRADEQTSLQQAQFQDADLRYSCWAGASLQQTTFDQAELDRVDFSATDCSHARLRRCRLRGANFTKAMLQETDFSDSDLLDSILRKARLLRTVLRHANLFAADLYKAEFDSPDLQGANLKKTLVAHVQPNQHL